MNLIKRAYSKIPPDIRRKYNVEPFYEYCLKNGIETPLMRGIDYSSDTAFTAASSPENRIDDSVHMYTFYFFKTLLESAGFVALPSNSIFVTFDEDVARSYGHLHYVFPIGDNYHYTFSEIVEDYMGLPLRIERSVSTPYQLNELYEEVFPAVLRFINKYTNDERFQLKFKDHVYGLTAIKKFGYIPERISDYAHKVFSMLETAKNYNPHLIMTVWFFLIVLYNTGKDIILRLLADCGIHSMVDIKKIDPSAAKNLLRSLKYHGDSDLHLAQNIIPVWSVAPEIMFRGKYLFVSRRYLEQYDE